MIKNLNIFTNPKLIEFATNTPPGRDRYVDFLRAFSITVVVLGHWLSAMVIRSESGFRICNAVGVVSGMWLSTWVLQVMPLFFFVGGFSNLVTLDSFRRRGKSLASFFRTRAIRLIKPTIVFLSIWFGIIIIIAIVYPGWMKLLGYSILIFGPLWFLAVYMGVIMATPIMRELHRRYRIYVLVVLFLLTVLVDLCRFWLRVPYIAWANIAFVWLFVHQIGFFYAEGSLARLPKRVYAIMALVGLVGLITLTNIGVYPRSMVGTGVEKVSNMNPPTVCISVLTLWLVGVAMLLRDPLTRWLSRLKPWIAVIWANSIIMTLYLWHLTAYALAFLILYPLGLGRQSSGNYIFWLERPLWLILPALILFFLLNIFGRFERVSDKKN